MSHTINNVGENMKTVNMDLIEYKILEDVHSLVLVLDKNGMIQYINNVATNLFEVPSDIKPGEYHFTTNINNPYNDKFCQYMLDAIYQKKKEHKGLVKYMSPKGKEYVFRISSSYMEAHSYVIITLEDLTYEHQLMEKVNASSLVFSAFLFLLTSWVMFCEFWDLIGRPIPTETLTRLVELFGTIIFIIIFKCTNVTLKDMGVITNHNKRDVKEGLIISAVFVALMFAIKIIWRKYDPNCLDPEHPFFYYVPRVALTYIATAGLQEFLARCVVQYNLEKIIQSKYKKFIAVVLSGLLFATLHIYYGFVFMTGAALLAMLEGIIYARQKSLVSIWIVHYIVGIVGMSLGVV